jgi:hypothetical protein
MILIEMFLNCFSIGAQTKFGEGNAPKRTHKGGGWGGKSKNLYNYFGYNFFSPKEEKTMIFRSSKFNYDT